MNSQSHAQHHVLPLRTYVMVTVGLLVLTAITVGISYMDFGVFNLLVAMAVAVAKAALVALYFMHLKYDNKIYLVVFLVALVTLGVLIFLTLADTMTRGDIDQEERGPINRRAAMYQQDTTAVPAAAMHMTEGQTNDTTASEDTSHAP